jgi:hypothetical protein
VLNASGMNAIIGAETDRRQRRSFAGQPTRFTMRRQKGDDNEAMQDKDGDGSNHHRSTDRCPLWSRGCR